MNYPLLSIALVTLLAFTGCGPSKPSKPTEADGRAAMERSIAKNSKDFIRLKSFTKTNGMDVMGMYSLEFDAELEVLADCLIDDRGWTRPIPASGVDRMEFDFKPHKKGETVTLHTSMLWNNTEKGWKPDKE